MAAPRASVTHQADGADDHVVERLRRPLLLPEQVADHRPRRLLRWGATRVAPPVLVDEALAEPVARLGERGEPLRRPPEVQQPPAAAPAGSLAGWLPPPPRTPPPSSL